MSFVECLREFHVASPELTVGSLEVSQNVIGYETDRRKERILRLAVEGGSKWRRGRPNLVALGSRVLQGCVVGKVQAV